MMGMFPDGYTVDMDDVAAFNEAKKRELEKKARPTMKGEYGEPWKEQYKIGIADRNDVIVGVIEDKTDKRRAIDCVNALDGMRAEKLAEVIRLAKQIISAHANGKVFTNTIYMMTDALKELEGE